MFELKADLATEARDDPGRIVLSHQQGDLTVGALWGWVNHHAEALRQLSEDNQSPWGLPIFVTDSLSSHLMVLACLVEEIPFAPLDGRAPTGRIDALLRVLGSPRIALEPESEAGFSGPLSQVITLPYDEPGSDTPASTFLPPENGLTILTSGSTGSPKGVHLPFSVLAAQLERLTHEFTLHDGMLRVSSLSPLHFISGIRRLYRGLLGAEVHVISPINMTVRGIVEEFHRRRITHLKVPPQVARLMTELDGQTMPVLDSVVEIQLGSEGVRFEVLQGLRRIIPDSTRVKHSLGATEGSSGIQNTFLLGDAATEGLVPVGLPTRPADVTFDPRPLVGEDIWEVLVTGPIASGYLGDQELNETRFSTDEDGKRWWHSGDLVTLGEDGLYVHHGRVDDLVKVRGMLASPSEATQALLALPGVNNAVVLPLRDNHNVRLVAHLERSSNSSITGREIRAQLQAALPDHLLPASFIFHERLPLTSRGKIDRNALNVS